MNKNLGKFVSIAVEVHDEPPTPMKSSLAYATYIEIEKWFADREEKPTRHTPWSKAGSLKGSRGEVWASEIGLAVESCLVALFEGHEP